MEINSDKAFTDAYLDSVDRSSWIPGKTYTVMPTAVCKLCTRPLYGSAHEHWHVTRHAKLLGLTYSDQT
jgi:hypothetical protein